MLEQYLCGHRNYVPRQVSGHHVKADPYRARDFCRWPIFEPSCFSPSTTSPERRSGLPGTWQLFLQPESRPLLAVHRSLLSHLLILSSGRFPRSVLCRLVESVTTNDIRFRCRCPGPRPHLERICMPVASTSGKIRKREARIRNKTAMPTLAGSRLPSKNRLVICV